MSVRRSRLTIKFHWWTVICLLEKFPNATAVGGLPAQNAPSELAKIPACLTTPLTHAEPAPSGTRDADAIQTSEGSMKLCKPAEWLTAHRLARSGWQAAQRRHERSRGTGLIALAAKLLDCRPHHALRSPRHAFWLDEPLRLHCVSTQDCVQIIFRSTCRHVNSLLTLQILDLPSHRKTPLRPLCNTTFIGRPITMALGNHCAYKRLKQFRRGLWVRSIDQEASDTLRCVSAAIDRREVERKPVERDVTDLDMPRHCAQPKRTPTAISI